MDWLVEFNGFFATQKSTFDNFPTNWYIFMKCDSKSVCNTSNTSPDFNTGSANNLQLCISDLENLEKLFNYDLIKGIGTVR